MKKYNLKSGDDYRIFVISDIHGHLNEFNRLVKKLDLKDEDILIILGDFVNKGYDSYNTLKAVMELSKRENTFVLKGNHEMNMQRVISDFEIFERIESFMRGEGFESLFYSMIKSRGLQLGDFPSMREVYDYLKGEFKEEIEFICGLNIIAENDDFIFVHGGFDPQFDKDDEKSFLKFDNYNEVSKVNHKTVVVGHWPASNLRYDLVSNEPFFNNEKNIISVDGGLGIKYTGELNAFVIDKTNGEIKYDLIQENGFEEHMIIKEHKFKKEETVYINYPNFDIEVIKKDIHTSRCLHKFSGKEFTIFNDLLNHSGDKPEVTMCYVNNFLNLQRGEKVGLVVTSKDHALVKYKKEFGWVSKAQLNLI